MRYYNLSFPDVNGNAEQIKENATINILEYRYDNPLSLSYLFYS